MNVRGTASLIWSLLRAELVFRRGAFGRASGRVGRAARYHAFVVRVRLRRLRSSYRLFVLRYEVRHVSGATARGLLHLPRVLLFAVFLLGFALRHRALGVADALRGRPRASLAAALTLALAVPAYALTAAVLDSGSPSSSSPGGVAAPAATGDPAMAATTDPAHDALAGPAAAPPAVPGTGTAAVPGETPGAAPGTAAGPASGGTPWTPAPGLVGTLEQFRAASVGKATPDPLPTFNPRHAPEAAEGTDAFGTSHAERHAAEPGILGPPEHDHEDTDLGK